MTAGDFYEVARLRRRLRETLETLGIPTSHPGEPFELIVGEYWRVLKERDNARAQRDALQPIVRMFIELCDDGDVCDGTDEAKWHRARAEQALAVEGDGTDD